MSKPSNLAAVPVALQNIANSRIISIYNNKGGVGKSTLTVGLAEFLAARRDRRVLVIDLDSQASSSCAILGKAALRTAIKSGRTITELARFVLNTKHQPDIDKFVTDRPASSARGTALAKLSVIAPDSSTMFEVEEVMQTEDTDLFNKVVKPALSQFDTILIDFPGNVNQRDKIPLATLAMSDFVLVPLETSQISLNGLPPTLDFIELAQKINGRHQPKIMGFVLNKTDKRAQQYRAKFPKILKASSVGKLPPIFKYHLPDTPKLGTATDDMLIPIFHTLRQRFGTYYDNVRKVALELDDRCNNKKVGEYELPKASFARRTLRAIFGSMGRSTLRVT